ncbi:alpha/beta hydrolase family protein [Pontibacter brevis]
MSVLSLLGSCNGGGSQNQRGQTQQEGNFDVNTTTTDGKISRMKQYTTSKEYPATFAEESLREWKRQMPEIQDVRIKSSADGKQEPSLFYDSGSNQKKPLLVVLHSWSSEYLQEVSLPYALWAKKYDWVFIHPNFRGAFDHPEATASDLAIQDIVDAVNFAKQQANVDPNRVYLVGSSGGAMTALVAAGRHPEIWAGVVAWVPILDLVDWYDFNQYYPHREYNDHIVASCGGEPIPGTPAAEDCKSRSPVTYLENARNVPIFLIHGINDVLVPPDHSMRAFNILANPKDRIPEEQMEHIVDEEALPPSLKGTNKDPYFAKADPPVVFERKSNNAKLVLYEGVHDMGYNPTLLWLADQQR